MLARALCNVYCVVCALVAEMEERKPEGVCVYMVMGWAGLDRWFYFVGSGLYK